MEDGRMLEEEKNSNTLDSFTYDEVNAKAKNGNKPPQ